MQHLDAFNIIYIVTRWRRLGQLNPRVPIRNSVTIAHVHVTEPGASAAEDDEVALSPSEPERRNVTAFSMSFREPVSQTNRCSPLLLILPLSVNRSFIQLAKWARNPILQTAG